MAIQVADFKYRLDGRAGSARGNALPRFQRSDLIWTGQRYLSLPPTGSSEKVRIDVHENTGMYLLADASREARDGVLRSGAREANCAPEQCSPLMRRASQLPLEYWTQG
jgi:hypothetical protein